MISKLCELLEGAANEFILNEFQEDYDWMVAQDPRVYRILDRFRGFFNMSIVELEEIFEEMGFQSPMEASWAGENSINLGDYIISFVENEYNTIVIEVDFCGKVCKYAIDTWSNQTVLYERVYKPQEGVDLTLRTSMDDSMLELVVDKSLHIVVKVGIPREEFMQVSPALEIAFLEHFKDTPLDIYYAIKDLCQNSNFISVKHTVENRGGEKVILSKVYGVEDSLKEVGILYRDCYLWVKGSYSWNYSTKDGLMLLSRTRRNQPILFCGQGKRGEVCPFVHRGNEVQHEAFYLANLYKLD